jgi:hypothetical protein
VVLADYLTPGHRQQAVRLLELAELQPKTQRTKVRTSEELDPSDVDGFVLGVALFNRN